jgi:hypothetical protein
LSFSDFDAADGHHVAFAAASPVVGALDFAVVGFGRIDVLVGASNGGI